jgi:hypothetical protein
VDVTRFLDEFRPFRRGELALARRRSVAPAFLEPAQLDLLRYALRLAQLTSLSRGRIDLVGRLESYRLRLVQLLAPILPTDPEHLQARKLAGQLPALAKLVGEARAVLLGVDLIAPRELDAELADKRLVLILGGAGGCGYVYLGALQRLEELALVPRYIVGCSLGAIMGVLRARLPELSLAELFDELRLLSLGSVFRWGTAPARFGFAGSLGLDLRGALGHLFAHPDGSPLRLRDLAIPVDVLVSGVRARAGAESLPAVELERLGRRAALSGRALARVRDAFVSLLMSRRLLEPLLLGADPDTAELPALDAAGFSSAIPYLLHYELPEPEARAGAILARLFERHGLEALTDGVMTSTTPAHAAWQAIESGRIGSGNCAIVALHAMQAGRGPTGLLLAPLAHAVSSTMQRDKPFRDLGVSFQRGPSLLELFPREQTLRRAIRTGRAEFEATAPSLGALLAPLPAWPEIEARASPFL